MGCHHGFGVFGTWADRYPVSFQDKHLDMMLDWAGIQAVGVYIAAFI
jgi:hypothetical protein